MATRMGGRPQDILRNEIGKVAGDQIMQKRPTKNPEKISLYTSLDVHNEKYYLLPKLDPNRDTQIHTTNFVGKIMGDINRPAI